ncbi:MAG: GTPase HflX [Bacteroidales bacterium]|nr:GTPase HflX [Bacteroidales bacterium]HPE85883.1 GTPase HflX [Bacteroidales bacterium]
MGKEKDQKAQLERAVLIGLVTRETSQERAEEYLKELEFLVETAGGQCEKIFIQKLDSPNPRTYVGSGKLEEIHHFVEDQAIDVVVFDDELSPSQVRNLEHVFNVKVLDRTNLILDIFASRARTAHAKVQVELAQYQYLLPRLTRMWTHLERQQGGIGMRGPGETEIETDRRIIRDRISLLKIKLSQIDKQMATQRGNRGKMVRVALVGYTNVGKSTIMNLLSKSEVFAENKLFATLDTTVRKMVIRNLPFLLSDTVGFIRKLPHGLVESFKSTLDEVREADLLIHVVDISHPDHENHVDVVKNTLHEIGASEIPVIMVFNKTDAYTWVNRSSDDLSGWTSEQIPLSELKNSWIAKVNSPSVFISAKTKHNIDAFKEQLYQHVNTIHRVRYPFNQYLYDDPDIGSIE